MKARLTLAFSAVLLASSATTGVGWANATPVWTITPSPGTGQGSVGLWAVSCPTATSCMAVGWYANGRALAEHWNGSKWSVMLGTSSPAGYV
jgi:hypothetical protein